MYAHDRTVSKFLNVTCNSKSRFILVEVVRYFEYKSGTTLQILYGIDEIGLQGIYINWNFLLLYGGFRHSL